jgi:hypothetical protein
MPWRSVMVMLRPSGLISHASAASPTSALGARLKVP